MSARKPVWYITTKTHMMAHVCKLDSLTQAINFLMEISDRILLFDCLKVQASMDGRTSAQGVTDQACTGISVLGKSCSSFPCHPAFANKDSLPKLPMSCSHGQPELMSSLTRKPAGLTLTLATAVAQHARPSDVASISRCDHDTFGKDFLAVKPQKLT